VSARPTEGNVSRLGRAVSQSVVPRR